MNSNLKSNLGRFKEGFIPWNKGKRTGIKPWLGKKRDKKTKEKISKKLLGVYIGKKSSRWKGGRFKTKQGYIYINCPEHPRVKRKKRKYLGEHTLIMEKYIGRYLKDFEEIHHINGIKGDNRIKNLRLMTDATHASLHSTKFDIDRNWLRGKYIIDKKSTPEIAKMLGTTPGTIKHRLNLFDIPVRSLSEAQQVRFHKGEDANVYCA